MRYTLAKAIWGLLVVLATGCASSGDTSPDLVKPPTEIIDEYMRFEKACTYYKLNDFECDDIFSKSFRVY